MAAHLVNPSAVLVTARAHAKVLRANVGRGEPLSESEANLLNAVEAYESRLRGAKPRRAMRYGRSPAGE